jgi:hypothetical protein
MNPKKEANPKTENRDRLRLVRHIHNALPQIVIPENDMLDLFDHIAAARCSNDGLSIRFPRFVGGPHTHQAKIFENPKTKKAILMFTKRIAFFVFWGVLIS